MRSMKCHEVIYLADMSATDPPPKHTVRPYVNAQRFEVDEADTSVTES